LASFEYEIVDVKKGRPSKEFLKPKLPVPIRSKRNKIMGLAFHPHEPWTILFYTLTHIFPTRVEKVHPPSPFFFCEWERGREKERD